jgi:hypothetical protein
MVVYVYSHKNISRPNGIAAANQYVRKKCGIALKNHGIALAD